MCPHPVRTCLLGPQRALQEAWAKARPAPPSATPPPPPTELEAQRERELAQLEQAQAKARENLAKRHADQRQAAAARHPTDPAALDAALVELGKLHQRDHAYQALRHAQTRANHEAAHAARVAADAEKKEKNKKKIFVNRPNPGDRHALGAPARWERVRAEAKAARTDADACRAADAAHRRAVKADAAAKVRMHSSARGCMWRWRH